MTRSRTMFPVLFALTSGLSAQTLTSEVVRDPIDTVTYTFSFSGPPRGTAYLFASPYLSPVPLPFAPFGVLHLDPLTLISVGSVPLDLGGQGRLPITLPTLATNGIFIASQALFIDQNLTFRLSLNWGGAVQHELGRDVPESMAWSTAGGPATRVQFQGSARFHKIVWRDATGAVIGECNLEANQAGNRTPLVTCPLQRPLRKGDTYETWESGDGQQWTRNRDPRPLP